MSKEKKTLVEGKNDGYVEIPLPNLFKVKEKIDGGLDRIGDTIDEIGTKQIAEDITIMNEKGRVGLDPAFSRAGVFFAILFVPATALAAWAGAPLWIYLFFALMWLFCGVLYLLGKYEIRHDGEGFSTRIGKRELHRYAWSDVTDVADKRKIYVNGKRLLADASMHGFDRFYHRARAACKGKGKTAPSEKKRKNRQKQKNKRK